MVTKIEVISRLRSNDNKYALQAVEEMRVRGWLFDGTLSGVALCRAELEGADLMKARLDGVDLHQANLEGADLRLCDLRVAKMVRANLQGANISDADLTRADLYKADLRGARNLTEEQLSKTTRLMGARMPGGEMYDGRYNLPGDLTLANWGKIDIENPEAMADFYGVSVEAYIKGQKIRGKQPASL